MRYIALSYLILICQGCGCSDTGREGHPDTDTDGEEDTTVHDPLVPDGPCGSCEDSDPCTMDLCNTETLECVNLPLDLDLDGHVPVECGGDDCDDVRPDVHAGAPEVCLDGVDQDCDTIVDGPVAMIPELRVTETEDGALAPEMVWTGSEYVIAWKERVDPNLFLTRISVLGEIADDHVLVRGSEHDLDRTELVWTGESLAMAWRESGGLMYARLSPAGAFEVPPKQIRRYGSPAMAWTGSELGIVWHDSDWILFLTVDLDGVITSDPDGIPSVVAEDVSRTVSDPGLALVWSGGRFGLVWDAYYPAGSSGAWRDLNFQGISAAGDPIGEPSMITDSGASWGPRLASTGSEIGMAWMVPLTGVSFRLMSPDGETVGRDHRLTDWGMESRDPDITWTGSEFALAWTTGPTGDESVTVALVDESGDSLFEHVHVMEVRSHIEQPRIVWSGSELGVAWRGGPDEEDCDPEVSGDCAFEVYFTRIGLCE